MRTRTIKTQVREHVDAPPNARVQAFTYAYEGGRNDLTADGDATSLRRLRMSEPHWILCDLETPDLDPEVGQPLEIGLVAVNRRLEAVAEWASPIKPFHGDWLDRLDPYVREMHSNSGLIGELRGARSHLLFEAGGLPTLEQAEAVACQFVAQFGHPPDSRGRPQAIIAGANVGKFERGAWFPRWLPKLEAMCSHRSLDTNFTFLAEQFLSGGPTEKSETRHRSLDDCYQALNGLRKFFGLGEVKR